MNKQWNITCPLKGMKLCLCRDMDGPTDCHTEWSKSEREKQIPILTYIFGIKKNGTDEPICKAEIETVIKEKIYGHQGEKWWKGMNWEIGIYIYTLLCIN